MATAPDASLRKQMKELLICCICDETLKEPRTLGCFHSFCKKCLGEYVESERKKAKKARKDEFDCPLCRTQFKLKQKDSIDQIRPCFFINNLLEMLSIQERVSQLHCEACKTDVSAVSRCIECEKYLCGNCLTVHNNWPDFNEHDVLTLEELVKPENQSKAKAKPRCVNKGHANKPLEIYCNTCNELACLTCVVLDHPKPNHECEPVDVAASKEKETLKATFDTLKRKFDNGHNALQKMKQASRIIQISNTRAKSIILEQEKEVLEEFTKKLKHTTAALTVEVERKNNELNQNLVKQHDDIKVYVEKLNGSLEFVKNIIQNGSNEDILSLGNEIKENANDIEKKSPKMMSPVHFGYFEYQQTKSATTVIDKVDLRELGKSAFAFTGGRKHLKTTFIFCLRNEDSVPPLFKCPISNYRCANEINANPYSGACFGSDLFISDEANTNYDSFSNLGYTYQPPPGYQPGTPETKALLAGSEKFQPSEIEVFSAAKQRNWRLAQ